MIRSINEVVGGSVVPPAATLCNPEVTLWMGDLRMEWDAEFVRNAFKHYSIDVANVKIVYDKMGGKATYCFIEFYDADSARNAMLTLCGRSIPNDPDRAKFNLSFANSPSQCTEYNLFVTNLSQSVDDVTLYRIFGEKYISCRGAKVYRNSDGSSREFGFVRFTNETDQQRALLEMHKQRLKGKEMVLRLAQPKERRSRYPQRDRGDSAYDNRRSSRYSRRDDDRSHRSYGGSGHSVGVATVQPQYIAMAPNHGVAGYGTVPLQTYGGAPAVLQTGGLMQQYVAVAQVPQYPGAMAPMAVHYQQNGAPAMLNTADPRALNPAAAGYAPVTPVSIAPVQTVFVEGEQPMSADEHNELLMTASGDFLTMLESSHWNRIAIPMSARTKDLATLMFNV